MLTYKDLHDVCVVERLLAILLVTVNIAMNMYNYKFAELVQLYIGYRNINIVIIIINVSYYVFIRKDLKPNL